MSNKHIRMEELMKKRDDVTESVQYIQTIWQHLSASTLREGIRNQIGCDTYQACHQIEEVLKDYGDVLDSLIKSSEIPWPPKIGKLKCEVTATPVTES